MSAVVHLAQGGWILCGISTMDGGYAYSCVRGRGRA
jgi:hypothetical protein